MYTQVLLQLRKIFFLLYLWLLFLVHCSLFYLKNNNYLYADLHSMFLVSIILLIGHFLYILGEPPICSFVTYMINFCRISSIIFSNRCKNISVIAVFFHLLFSLTLLSFHLAYSRLVDIFIMYQRNSDLCFIS